MGAFIDRMRYRESEAFCRAERAADHSHRRLAHGDLCSILSAYTFASGLDLQSELALQGIRVGASEIPCISILLGMLPMWLSPIDLQREQALSAFSESQHRGPHQRGPEPLAQESLVVVTVSSE
jgi:hypothetical protein